MARRALVRTGNLAAALVAAAVLFLVANLVAGKFWHQWDWTSAGLYTLSPETRTIVGRLDRDVRIVSFLVEGAGTSADVVQQVRAITDAYRQLNPKRVTVEWIDPQRDPVRAQALLSDFRIDPRDPRTLDVIVVEAGRRRKQVPLSDMVEYDQSAAMSEAAPAVKALTVESALTGAIVGVTRAKRPVVRFATGHGEHELDATSEAGFSQWKDALARMDVEAIAWDALGAAAVPDGTDAVVVAGPATAWLPPERDALAAFLGRGGRALLMLDPAFQRGGGTLVPSGLEPLLAGWGVTPQPDIVVDPKGAVPFFGAETFYAPAIGLHPVTSSIANQPVLFVLARSLAMASPTPAGTELHALVETSNASWGETDLAHLDAIRQDDRDLKGPLEVAVAAERKPAQGRAARLVVTGDSDVASNLAFDRLANRAFLLDAIGWLVAEESAPVIPPKERTLAKLFLTEQQTTTLFVLLVVLLPATAIGAGLVVWSRRRKS